MNKIWYFAMTICLNLQSDLLSVTSCYLILNVTFGMVRADHAGTTYNTYKYVYFLKTHVSHAHCKKLKKLHQKSENSSEFLSLDPIPQSPFLPAVEHLHWHTGLTYTLMLLGTYKIVLHICIYDCCFKCL